MRGATIEEAAIGLADCYALKLKTATDYRELCAELCYQGSMCEFEEGEVECCCLDETLSPDKWCESCKRRRFSWWNKRDAARCYNQSLRKLRAVVARRRSAP